MTHAVSWSQFERQAPELASRIRERFAAHRHLVMATLRADGSPRLSGTEAHIVAGELEIGVMAGAARLADLARDPRVALHSSSDDPPAWAGDASISGRTLFVEGAAARLAHLAATGNEGEPGEWSLLRIRITEAVHVALDASGSRLVVESWRPGRGIRRHER